MLTFNIHITIKVGAIFTKCSTFLDLCQTTWFFVNISRVTMRRMKNIAFFFLLFEQAANGIACMGKIIKISKQNETPKFSLIRTVHFFLTSPISFFFYPKEDNSTRNTFQCFSRRSMENCMCYSFSKKEENKRNRLAKDWKFSLSLQWKLLHAIRRGINNSWTRDIAEIGRKIVIVQYSISVISIAPLNEMPWHERDYDERLIFLV